MSIVVAVTCFFLGTYCICKALSVPSHEGTSLHFSGLSVLYYALAFAWAITA